MRAEDLSWKFYLFSELSLQQLYNLLRLREEVFIVEQNCPYLDADDKDSIATHLLGELDGKLLAYARLFKPGDYYEESAIGRIVSHPSVRSSGVGKGIMKRSIRFIEDEWKEKAIKLAAQSYVLQFYRDFGFVETGEEFLEDGIPHRHMIKKS